MHLLHHHHHPFYTALIMPTTRRLFTSPSSLLPPSSTTATTTATLFFSSSLPRFHSLFPRILNDTRPSCRFPRFSMRRLARGSNSAAVSLVLSRTVHLQGLENKLSDAERLAILKARLREEGIHCGDCMPGQYGHMLCPRDGNLRLSCFRLMKNSKDGKSYSTNLAFTSSVRTNREINFEMIIVDDGSANGTQEIVKQLQQLYGDDRILLQARPRNLD